MGFIQGPLRGSDPWVPSKGPTYIPGVGWQSHTQIMPEFNIGTLKGEDSLAGTEWISMPQGFNPWGTGAFDAVGFPQFMGGGLTATEKRYAQDWGLENNEMLLAKAEYQAGRVNAMKQQQLMGIYGRQTDAAQGTFGMREGQQAAEQAQRGQGLSERMLSMQRQVPGMWGGRRATGASAEAGIRPGVRQGVGGLYKAIPKRIDRVARCLRQSSTGSSGWLWGFGSGCTERLR